MAAHTHSLIILLFSSLMIPNFAAQFELITKICSSSPHKNPDSILMNYDGVKEELVRTAAITGVIASREDVAAPVYAIAECWDSLNPTDCRSCVDQMASELRSCFPKSGGRVYADGCFVRAESFNFYKELRSNFDHKRCENGKNFKQEYSMTAKRLIDQMMHAAPPSHNRWISSRSQVNGTSVQGIAKCWHTLDKVACKQCLEQAASSAIKCLPAAEGRALFTGCFMHYSNYQLIESPLETKSESVRRNQVTRAYYGVGAAVIIALAICTGFFGLRLASSPKRIEPSDVVADPSAINRGLHFKYSTLEKATGFFCEAHRLGQGGYGAVFRGVLQDGREIAIKRLFGSGKHQGQDVYNELDIISRADHKNLVRLLGCCFTDEESLLIYEYLPNRSLDLKLFDNEKKNELNWKTRLGIIRGTAEGLQYLHNECQVRIIHRDIKASNILLDLSHKAKISDFGLARFHPQEKIHVSNTVSGTLGYMAPEYISQGRLTEKVDIYGYGVLVLEIISGLSNNAYQPDDESLESLVAIIWKHFQSNTISEMIDQCLQDDHEEIRRVAQVGLLCTQEIPEARPSMSRVIEMLENKDMELPIPSRPPFTNLSVTLLSSLENPQRPNDVASTHVHRHKHNNSSGSFS